jgi:transcriptional regulator with XRE-family HTH domain
LIYFSNNLKFLRSAKGLKQSDLAHRLNVKTNTISNYENGISEPDFKILDAIINIFDINSFDLLFKDISSQSVSDYSYTQEQTYSDIVSEPSPDKKDAKTAESFKNCTEKERIINAQQITIDELRADKAYLKEEIRELKKKLESTQKK